MQLLRLRCSYFDKRTLHFCQPQWLVVMLGWYCESVEEHQNDDQPIKRHRFDGQAALPAAESVPAAPAPTAGRGEVESGGATPQNQDEKVRDHKGLQLISNLRRSLRSWWKFMFSLSKQAVYYWKRTLNDNAVNWWKPLRWKSKQHNNSTNCATWRQHWLSFEKQENLHVKTKTHIYTDLNFDFEIFWLKDRRIWFTNATWRGTTQQQFTGTKCSRSLKLWGWSSRKMEQKIQLNDYPLDNFS